MQKIIVTYMPVIHRGYLHLFKRHREANTLYILSNSILGEFKYLRKDIRALPPHFAVSAVRGWDIFPSVVVADARHLLSLNTNDNQVIMPDEELSRYINAKYFPHAKVEYDSVFLRWEQESILKERNIQYERTMNFEGVVEEMMGRAFLESHKATNLWRWVGSIISKDREIILTGYNKQVPNSYTPYYEGDARMFFKKGLHIELTTDHHAEARMIAEAARKGIALEGTDLYITAFPCPPCAKSVAAAGIRRCYFASGYSMLDGERILKDNDVEIIHVQIPGNIV